MSQNVTWPPIGGTSYPVPNTTGEVNWTSLTNYLVALGNAQSTTNQKVGVRIATASPIAVASATDYMVVSNLTVPGAVVVNLPAAQVGQAFVVKDGKGDASTNNITINRNGTDTIDGATSIVIGSNFGSVLLTCTAAGSWSVFQNAAPMIAQSLAAAPTYSPGRIWYDNVDNTLRYYNDSPTDSVNIGQELNVKVRNTSGSTINPGQVVRVTGAVGGVPTVSLAQANSFANAKVYAVVTESIANNSNGYATIAGLIKNLNLSAFADGDVLFLSASVAGGLTATRPAAPNYAIPIGAVSSNNVSTGRLIVQLAYTRPLGFGTANQISGMNAGATEIEYKNFLVTTAGQMTAGTSSGLGTTGSPYQLLYGSLVSYSNATNASAIASGTRINLNANLYRDGASTVKAVETVTGYTSLEVTRTTSSTGTVLAASANYQDAQTANAAAVVTNDRALFSVNALGAWTFGNAVSNQNQLWRGLNLYLRNSDGTQMGMGVTASGTFLDSFGADNATNATTQFRTLRNDGSNTLIYLSVTGAGGITFPQISNSVSGNLNGGTYTPVATVGTNVSSASTLSAKYTRVGNIVTVCGQMSVATTAAANTESRVQITLPISSNIAAGNDVLGVCVQKPSGGTAIGGGVIQGDPATDRAELVFNSTQTSASNLSYSFQYTVL